ncbi:MAG: glycosyltransferase family 2 protein [Muribaculaceae bacterium]|nr:glycosyltransferase family 2 protein [Muribaculaceae bacterium]
MPLISVIIPVYNVERFVEECLRSVFAQTMRDYEVIMVDDCSTDGSMDIVHRVCDECAGNINVRILSTGKTSGVSVARNMGIDASTARYVYFVDSDDYISTDALEHLSRVAARHPQAQIVYGTGKVVGNDSVLPIIDIASKNFPEYVDDAKKAGKMMLTHRLLPDYIWNRLFLREWLNAHSLRFKPEIMAQDKHIGFYMAKYVTAIAFCNATTYYYRTSDYNVSALRSRFQWACIDWIISDWTRNLTSWNLPAQLMCIIRDCHTLYTRSIWNDGALPPLWRRSAGALLYWARLMRRYGKEIPKENNINQ